MSLPEILQPTLKEALLTTHGAELPPRCHRADDLFRLASGILVYKCVKGRLPSGEKLWLSSGEGQGTIGEEDATFRMITSRTLFRHNIPRQVINVAVNGEWGRPAAYMFPPEGAGTSANIVVGTSVNDPDQIGDLLTVIIAIDSASHYTKDPPSFY